VTTPYVGEIRIFGFPRIPNGWMACDGSLKPISTYQVLFTLLGTTYGGDGITTFAVPDLRGQVPLHQGTGQGLTRRTLGEVGGNENVTLLSAQMPQHNHSFMATTNAATATSPGTTVQPGTLPSDHIYLQNISGTPTADAMAQAMIQQTGGSLPHNNIMPTLTLSICIAWAGVFPSQS
jgi:microcystin-dependent protein